MVAHIDQMARETLLQCLRLRKELERLRFAEEPVQKDDMLAIRYARLALDDVNVESHWAWSAYWARTSVLFKVHSSLATAAEPHCRMESVGSR